MKLPVMRCDNGCGDCCGVVPVTDEDFNRVVAYAQLNGIEPRDQGITCPFYDGRCQVYPVRPIICRVFGHSPKLKCSRGYNVDLPEKKIRKLVESHGRPSKTLHDALAKGRSGVE